MQKKMIRFAVFLLILLLVPLVLTIRDRALVGDGWHWSAGDFVFAFIIPMSAAFIYELIALRLTKPAYRLAAGVMVAAMVLALWVELATGAVSRTVGLN